MIENIQRIDDKRYQIIPRTLVFLFNHKDQVLLIKGGPGKKLWANQYNGIGGHIERGEGVYSAARRELYEEAHIMTLTLWLCGTVMIDTGSACGVGLFIFKGKYEGGKIEPSEEGSMEWVFQSELEQLPLVDDLFILLPKITKNIESDKPFSARMTDDGRGEKIIVFD